MHIFIDFQVYICVCTHICTITYIYNFIFSANNVEIHSKNKLNIKLLKYEAKDYKMPTPLVNAFRLTIIKCNN